MHCIFTGCLSVLPSHPEVLVSHNYKFLFFGHAYFAVVSLKSIQLLLLTQFLILSKVKVLVCVGARQINFRIVLLLDLELGPVQAEWTKRMDKLVVVMNFSIIISPARVIEINPTHIFVCFNFLEKRIYLCITCYNRP